jgi:hypothetical protein
MKTAEDTQSNTLPYGSEAFDNKASLTTEYAYDTNGSMTYDANSGISTIGYNVLNQPNVIQFAEGHKNLYTYGADGKKLEIVNYTLHTPVNVPQGSISTLPTNAGDCTKVTTDYIGNCIYENGALKELLLPEGYWQSGTYYYYLQDHLGNNRIVIDQAGNIIEKSHYYPSGMRFYPESSSNSAALPYRYNNKELETMNGASIFKFAGQNSNVEWSLSKTGIVGETGLNFLTTSHERGIEYGGGDLFNKQLNTYTYRGMDHTHDNNSSAVSPADRAFAALVQSQFPNAQFNIYRPGFNQYVPFNSMSKTGDQLNKIQVVAPRIMNPYRIASPIYNPLLNW